jgi:hypothetical protein
MPDFTLPLTYDECRARFRETAARAGQTTAAHPIGSLGPEGQRLTVESLVLGAAAPRRALIVMSGVHGVEGFIGSALQCDLLATLDPGSLPSDMAVLFVHAVNPWGMAWWRRQNESNVDLNRNWRRDRGEPAHNDAYDELHALLCPDARERPPVGQILAEISRLAQTRGPEWVRDGITFGQYRHADGLHYGGARTEASTRIVEELVGSRLQGVERLATIDLHTGHGPSAALTLLCDQPRGSEQHRFLAALGTGAVEVTAGGRAAEGVPAATTAPKAAQIANGFAQLFPGADSFATSAEFGTVSDGRQLVMTILEQWSHRQGRRDDPACRDIVWGYRCCFTPDNAAWVAACVGHGRALLRAAVIAVASWPDR